MFNWTSKLLITNDRLSCNCISLRDDSLICSCAARETVRGHVAPSATRIVFSWWPASWDSPLSPPSNAGDIWSKISLLFLLSDVNVVKCRPPDGKAGQQAQWTLACYVHNEWMDGWSNFMHSTNKSSKVGSLQTSGKEKSTQEMNLRTTTIFCLHVKFPIVYLSIRSLPECSDILEN